MQTTKEEKPKSLVLVKGSFGAEEFAEYITNATRHFIEEAELPGFRKGKAPEKMVLEKIGDNAVLEEAANMALQKHYPTILKEQNIRPISQPKIRITKLARGNDMEFEAEITVLPTITLPDYKEIAKKKNAGPKEEIAVLEEEIQKTIDQLRKSRKTKDGETEKLPELNDEFAKSLGNFKTVEDLKNAIRDNLQYEKERKAADKRRMELLHAILDGTTVEIPDNLIEGEKDKMFAEMRSSVEQMGMQWQQYLEHIKKTEEALRTEWQNDAEKRVKSALTLREIGEREHIQPEDGELNAWVYQYLASQPDDVKQSVDQERLKDYAYGILRNEKVFVFLESC